MGSGPFTWVAMDETITQLANSAFVRGLREYGVRNVSHFGRASGCDRGELSSV